MVLGGDFENSLARGGEMWHNNELERAKRSFWAIGAAGAQVPYKHKAGGSNPSSPTMNSQTRLQRLVFFFLSPANSLKCFYIFTIDKRFGLRKRTNSVFTAPQVTTIISEGEN